MIGQKTFSDENTMYLTFYKTIRWIRQSNQDNQLTLNTTTYCYPDVEMHGYICSAHILRSDWFSWCFIAS